MANFDSSAELFPWHGAYCGDIDLLGHPTYFPLPKYVMRITNKAGEIRVKVSSDDLTGGEIMLKSIE
ncbi:hypothetical protein [Pedobacter sp. Leaf176]|uniref:hypothetical protein n=1 Tax=Pedobacter sp. Leaf176 TaxID=1736286 RepID=UPI0006F66776|nr:hypothetical protein [Pedobacter sp. Leaf176]KQR70313.1 hypothetical protein ASF92_10020 [Pedobacter sp. Leaf176]